MPDQNNKNNTSAADFGMEGDEKNVAANSATPKINNYARSGSTPPQPNVSQGNVNPSAPVSPTPVKSTVKPANPTMVQARPANQTTPSGQPLPPRKPAAGNPEARKKALLGCLGAFGALVLIMLILSFVFLAQSDEGQSPIARLLGIDQATFVNGLITFVHLIFIVVSLTAFVFTMVGLFKASMAKKGDKITRREGLRTSLIAGVVLFGILIVWMFVYLYLDSKRVAVGPDNLALIVTEPEETINLTAPIEVKFDASNVRVDSGKFRIVAYDWDFGDKSSGTNMITSHIYKDKGTYTVVLTVTVEDLKTGGLLEGGTYTHIVSVANQALTAIFTADPQSGEVPLVVKFDATDSVDPDGVIEKFEWDLDGDGSYDDADGDEIGHEFTKIGTYSVGLRVTSTTGEFATFEKDIIVEEAKNPEAKITIIDNPQSFTTGQLYNFKADDSTSPNGQIEKYEWDFGDGTKPATTKTVSHTYAKAGSYELTLKVTDEKDETGEQKMIIRVLAPQGTPQAVIKTTPAATQGATFISGTLPFTVSFDATASTDSDNNIIEYSWDFDGNGTADAFNSQFTKTYNEAGTYNAMLTVTDSDGNKGSAVLTVKVEEQGIVADLKSDKVSGEVPVTVNFDASGSTYKDGQITSYRWDFGDGTSPKLGAANISHKYTAIGTYTATVTVIGSDNTTATDTLNITVREIGLSACFTSVFEEGPAPLVTTFDPGCSTGTINTYFWDFGDGGTSTQIKPQHTFQSAGEYRVVLEIADSDSNVSRAELYITVTE